MKAKRVFTLAVAAALTLALLAGCGAVAAPSADPTAAPTAAPATEAPSTEAPATEAPAELSGSVSTNGSTSMEKVVGILSEQFMLDNPGVSVTYDPTGSGTRDGFESVTGTSGECVLAQELTSTGAVISAVAANPNAIGYASLSAVEGQEGVKAVKVNGVVCSEETVLDGTYAVQRPFTLVTREGEELSPAAKAFFDFDTSTAANDLIRQAGAVPVAK